MAEVLDGSRQWWIEPCHVLDGLRALPDESVNCVVTSPPYWGLRAYGTKPQVWGGGPGCEHDWTPTLKRGTATSPSEARVSINHADSATRQTLRSELCAHCGAWRGELGSEPTIGLFIQHLVEIFREARRVLRPDATCWINIGDCYAGSGRGPSSSLNLHNPHSIGVSNTQQLRNGQPPIAQPALEAGQIGKGWTPIPDGLKPKDLCLIPERLAIALQDDGWWIRSRIAWCKAAPMPESVRDRPTNAWEHIWLLTKSRKYSYDIDAVREPQKSIGERHEGKAGYREGHPSRGGFDADDVERAFSRKRETIAEPRQNGYKVPSGWQTGDGSHDSVPAGRYHHGYEYDHRELNPLGANLRSWWLLSPEPFPEAHFATFPTELARRCVLAGCPQGGIVLDPFSGSGTTVMVATRLNRRGIGLELNPAYVQMSRHRVVSDAPLWNHETGPKDDELPRDDPFASAEVRV